MKSIYTKEQVLDLFIQISTALDLDAEKAEKIKAILEQQLDNPDKDQVSIIVDRFGWTASVDGKKENVSEQWRTDEGGGSSIGGTGASRCSTEYSKIWDSIRFMNIDLIALTRMLEEKAVNEGQ